MSTSSVSSSTSSSGTISFSGLASGLDSASIISKLMDVERTPITALENKVTYLTSQDDTYTQFDTLLDEFNTAVSGLDSESDLNTFTVNNSGSDYFSVSTNSLAKAGSYSIEVVSLAQQQKDVSTNYIADTSSTTLSGSLVFGDSTLDYSGVTLSSLVDQINDGDYGVTASILNDGTGSGYRLKLTGNTAGEETAITGTGSIEIDTATNGHSIDASKAHLIVDGVDIYSSSNTVTNAIKGATLTLLDADEGTTRTLTLNSDAENTISTQLQKIVDAYNSINTYVDKIRDSDSATARSMETIQRSLKNYLTGSSLATMGISSDWETGKLSFSSTKFSSAYEADSSTITEELFGSSSSSDSSSSSTGGIMTRMSAYLTKQLDSSTGFLATKEDSINTQKDALEDKITSMEARLEKRQSTLEAQYSAMETLVSSLNSQSSYLTNFFDSYNSSS